VFFNRFKQLCDQKNISVYRACTDIGLNRSAVAKWKNGGKPNGSTAAKLAEYFEEAFGLEIEGYFVINFSGAVDLINAGRIQIAPLITHRYPIEKLEEAIHMQMSAESIKVVVGNV